MSWNAPSILSILMLCYAALLVAAAVQDLRTLRISNLISIALLAICGVALAMNHGAWWEHALSFAITLGMGVALYSFGWFGGGDAKLMAAAALAFDLSGLLRFIPLVLIIGGLVAILFMARRLVSSAPLPPKEKRVVPYALPIALGAIAMPLLFPAATLFAAS